MLRRLISSHLRPLASSLSSSFSASPPPHHHRIRLCCVVLFVAVNVASSKPRFRVEDLMPIATGHEREELEALLQGKNILDINHPVGPFGTKEAPAFVKSVYDERIVGCPGGEGEDEHDVVWFRLKKGKPVECPVCTQYFVLEVVGKGGSPHGHDNEEEHAH